LPIRHDQYKQGRLREIDPHFAVQPGGRTVAERVQDALFAVVGQPVPGLADE
jgi:hypothetical protein